MLAGLLIIEYGSIQESPCVQCIPRSLVDVLETVCTEKGATEMSSDHDEDVVNVLGGYKYVDLETSLVISYQNLEKVSQSTARSCLSIIVIIYQSTGGG